MAEEKKIPLYTKIGGRLTIILILLLSIIILKNCVGAIIYGTATDQTEITKYHDMGFAHGTQHAAGTSYEEPAISNPLLKKAYRQGFRKGWDSAQSSRNDNMGSLPSEGEKMSK